MPNCKCSLKRRLKRLGLDVISTPVSGSSRRTQVVKVRYSHCKVCNGRRESYSCHSCLSPFAAKFIPPSETSRIGIDEAVFDQLISSPVPEAAVVYRQRWTDEHGDIILMDIHQTTVKEVVSSGYQLTEYEWMVIMSGLFSRLAAALDHGLVHGDLKPSNVLIDPTKKKTLRPDNVHIADYGLIFYSECKSSTRSGPFVGSFPYVSPEVLLNGESSLSHFSDIWAAGCIGYELCTGKQLPHVNERHGNQLENIEKFGKDLDLSDVSSGYGGYVTYAIERCLTWDAAKRPTAAQMVENLRRYVSSDSPLETRRMFPLRRASTLSVSSASTASTDSTRRSPSPRRRRSVTPLLEDSTLAEIDDDTETALGRTLSVSLERTVSTSSLELSFSTASLNTLFEPDDVDFDEFGWTTGGDAALRHRSVIDRGASGEVHELYDGRTKRVFARKLVRPFGDITAQTIRRELDAVRKLCDPGEHANIVKVFELGRIAGQMIWFIDMERCDLNLETYISRNWTPELHTSVPFFTQIDLCPTSQRIQQIGEIIRDIVKGVAFIHSQQLVHRDLKPRNVLYSRPQHSWKIADFGLTTEGTSQKSYTTHYSRGTSSYRAPELVRSGTYNNKADIWAIGCILYEVVTLQKAFSTDNAVYDYSMRHAFDGEKMKLPLDLGVFQDAEFEEAITDLIHSMLEVDSSMRPSAVDLMVRLELAFRESELRSESEAEARTFI